MPHLSFGDKWPEFTLVAVAAAFRSHTNCIALDAAHLSARRATLKQRVDFTEE
jgi:hypothetical protein